MLPAHLNPILGKNDAYILRTLDGSETLFSRQFQATYHSLNGAVSESRHIFIQHGLKKLPHLPSISVLEFGFGTGLNAFLALLFSRSHSKEISYTGIESFPLEKSLVQDLNYPDYLVAPELNHVFEQMHNEDAFVFDRFTFQKLRNINQLPSDTLFDCIFFDAFSPKEHPAAWEQDIFDQISAMTSKEGVFVTYCAMGEVRRRLEKSGFHVVRQPGAPGKREMIQAFKK